MLLGEPVLLGRMKDGKAFALRDICPHRGVPLSAGRVMPENTVECPYHGWRFRADGVCALIPSLVDGQDIEPGKIRVRSYPVREQDGLIWIYMPATERSTRHAAQASRRACGVPNASRAGWNARPSAAASTCRDRLDGSGARALRPRPLVVARNAAGEREERTRRCPTAS